MTYIFDRSSFETNLTTTTTTMTSSKSSNSIEAQDTTSSIKIDPGTVNNKFCLQKATTSLNVTCYGSSSAKTPIRYLEEARSLGYMLARRGHICINGTYNIHFHVMPFFSLTLSLLLLRRRQRWFVSNGRVTGSFCFLSLFS